MFFSYGLAGDWFIGSGNPCAKDIWTMAFGPKGPRFPMVKLTWASE